MFSGVGEATLNDIGLPGPKDTKTIKIVSSERQLALT